MFSFVILGLGVLASLCVNSQFAQRLLQTRYVRTGSGGQNLGIVFQTVSEAF